MANLDLAGIITRVCTDLRSKFSKVSVTPLLTSGTKSATVTVDGTNFDLYAPASYTLPTATASTLGGVKVDGTTIIATDGVISATGMTVLQYGTSTWADFQAAYEANKLVYCMYKVSANETRMAFLAYTYLTGRAPKAEFQYYRTVGSKSATQQGDEVYIYTLTKNSGWTTTVRQTYTKIVAGTGLTSTYSANTGTLTLEATLPPATVSTLGGVKVGDGLSVAADGTLALVENGYVTQTDFKTVLDDTWRITVVAADAISAAVIGNAFGEAPEQRMPNGFINAYAIFLAINNRYYLAWMHGAKMELAPLNAEVDAQTQAITLYARGRSSMAYGVAGVDESWTITALPTDVDGVSF